MGSWTCEDWLRWAEIYSDFLRDEVAGVSLPSVAAEMWPLLQKAICHYIHGGPEAYAPENRASVEAGLLQYAVLAETHHPRMMTSNLHRTLCWLPEQEKKIGLAAYIGELWGERALQWLKNIARNRVSKDPEKVHAIALLVRGRLALFQAQHGWVPSTESLDDDFVGTVANNGNNGEEPIAIPEHFDDTSGTIGLQGPGKRPNEEQQAIIIKGIEQLISERVISTGRGGWRSEHLNSPQTWDIWVHDYALIGDTRTITSELYNL